MFSVLSSLKLKMYNDFRLSTQDGLVIWADYDQASLFVLYNTLSRISIVGTISYLHAVIWHSQYSISKNTKILEYQVSES